MTLTTTRRHFPFYPVFSMILLVLIFSGFTGFNPSVSLAQPQPRSTFTVNTTADTLDVTANDNLCADSNGQCSLRAAILSANDTPSFDTIILPAGTYTISRLGVEDSGINGDFDILAPVSIQGAGAASTIIDAGGLDSVFHVPDDVEVERDFSLADVTVRNASGSGQFGITISRFGTLYLTDSIVTNNATGVRIEGDASLERVTISGSTADAFIHTGWNSQGVVLIKDSLITDNHVTGSFDSIVFNLATMIMDNVLITANTSAESDGGAIYSSGTLTVTGSTISNNQAEIGGALYVYGTTTLTKVIIENNRSEFDGGGIYNDGIMTLTEVIVRNNEADSEDEFFGLGGGIFNSGDLTVLNSEISGNSAYGDNPAFGGAGGGIYNDYFQDGGEVTIRNSTISGNFAGLTTSTTEGWGGGIYNHGGKLSLNNVTIADNTAGEGGGLMIVLSSGSLTSDVTNSLIAGNTTGTTSPNCYTQDITKLVSLGYNLLGSGGTNCPLNATGDQVGGDPLLLPLADNGGFTRTHALQAGSPAIDGGNAATCLTTDQRFAPRVGTCEQGAFEFGGSAPTSTPVPSITPGPTASITLTPSVTPVIVTALITNGGFETGAPVPDGWTGSGLDNDKRVCDKPEKGKFFAHSGSCAFRFKASTGVSSRISQKITAPTVATGNILSFSGWFNAKNLTAASKVDVKIKYSDGTKEKPKLTLAPGTYDYIAAGVTSEPITGSIASVTVTVRVTNGSGKLVVDDFELNVAEAPADRSGFGSRAATALPAIPLP